MPAAIAIVVMITGGRACGRHQPGVVLAQAVLVLAITA
jgi:hypothetical protein